MVHIVETYYYLRENGMLRRVKVDKKNRIKRSIINVVLQFIFPTLDQQN